MGRNALTWTPRRTNNTSLEQSANSGGLLFSECSGSRSIRALCSSWHCLPKWFLGSHALMQRIFTMHHLLRLTVLLSFLLTAAPTFAQQNSQLIPDSLAAIIRGTENASLYAYFSSSEIGDVAVLGVFGEGNACPAMFRIAYPDSLGKYVVTKEFGDCSDIPTIIFEEKQVTLKFPGYAPLSAQSEPNFRSPPPTTYVFSNGRLREIKTQNKRRK